jgi:hypothetical protein
MTTAREKFPVVVLLMVLVLCISFRTHACLANANEEQSPFRLLSKLLSLEQKTWLADWLTDRLTAFLKNASNNPLQSIAARTIRRPYPTIGKSHGCQKVDLLIGGCFVLVFVVLLPVRVVCSARKKNLSVTFWFTKQIMSFLYCSFWFPWKWRRRSQFVLVIILPIEFEFTIAVIPPLLSRETVTSALAMDDNCSGDNSQYCSSNNDCPEGTA